MQIVEMWLSYRTQARAGVVRCPNLEEAHPESVSPIDELLDPALLYEVAEDSMNSRLGKFGVPGDFTDALGSWAGA